MKRVFSLMLALMLVGSLIFLPDMAVLAQSANRTVTIPSPDDYFGTVKKTNSSGDSNLYYFDGYSTYPKSKMESYIKALKKAGLTGGTVQDDRGSKVASLKYDGETAMWVRWDKSSKQMMVNINKGVSINNDSNAEKDMPTTPTKAKVKDTSLSIPNPGDYFTGLKAERPLDSKGQISYDYSYASYPQTAVDKYVKVLEALGLKAGKQNKFINGDYTRTVRYDSTVCVKFNYDASADILTVYLYAEDLKKSGFGIDQIDTRETEPTENIPTTPTDAPYIPAEETVSVGEDKTIRIKKGQKLKLESKYTESAGAKVYTWSVTSGSNVITIDSVGRNCDVTALKKGTAIIGLKYQYSYWGSDVLTGNTRRVNAQRTREYTIIVE